MTILTDAAFTGDTPADQLAVTVIICAYTERRWDDVVAAVGSVFDGETTPLEVILVIDHNADLLARAAERFADTPGVRVVANAETQGLSGARNTGVTAAAGEVIAFLDDDAAAQPGWIDRLVESFADADVIGVGGGADPVWPAEAPRWFPSEFGWVIGCSFTGQPTTAEPVRNVIGCNMAFRAEVFARIGGFAQSLGRLGTVPLGCEETEFCIRAGRAWPRARIMLEPDLRVAHRVSEDRVRVRYFLSRCHAEGRSKAQVSKLVGAGDGLSSERTYTTRTLPIGVLRNLAVTPKDRYGPVRAALICLGFTWTVAGYLRGRLGV